MKGFNYSREEVIPTTTSSGNEHLEFTPSDEHEIHRSSSSQRVQHTRHQIERLEKFFKKKDHPSKVEMIEIGRELKIEEKKVKFWFQNRRSQLKAQMERDEMSIMKKENEKLNIEILALKEVVRNSICRNCGAQKTILDSVIEHHKLKMENEQLKEKLSYVTSLINKKIGTPSTLASDTTKDDSISPLLTSLELAVGSSNNNITNSQMGIEIDIQRSEYLLEQASSAMEELLKLELVNAPMWNRNKEGGGETLDFNEYVKLFPLYLGIKPPGFVSEATRASSVVPMNSSTLVEALLNADRWREMFTGMIGSCTTMEVISKGLGGSKNGALQLMKAEIQLVSPLVPVRFLKFIRFTKKQADGIWIVVDVGYGMEGHLTRRCPSGCILEDMPNGLSKVTWIEHVQYDEQSVSHQYRGLISSGLGFGAQKWISALVRYCEGLRATTSPTHNTHLLDATKRSLKCLAQHMTSIFCAAVCLTKNGI
ncbi:homeobox-leucine zipper protein ROC5-like [Bidens hawaiensis]|uniref:homeobox-leucine zipper protein ROC5-like n=1 Tax=Bidens hawaiensis TaxID=980011 RepID=UPI00404A2956